MFIVVRENETMAVRDKHQLAAFLNNGWSLSDTSDKEEKTIANTIIPFYGEVKYTKTDINRMSTADLQALAAEQGIENATELSGAELKKLLIEKFGL